MPTTQDPPVGGPERTPDGRYTIIGGHRRRAIDHEILDASPQFCAQN